MLQFLLRHHVARDGVLLFGIFPHCRQLFQVFDLRHESGQFGLRPGTHQRHIHGIFDGSTEHEYFGGDDLPNRDQMRKCAIHKHHKDEVAMNESEEVLCSRHKILDDSLGLNSNRQIFPSLSRETDGVGTGSLQQFGVLHIEGFHLGSDGSELLRFLLQGFDPRCHESDGLALQPVGCKDDGEDLDQHLRLLGHHSWEQQNLWKAEQFAIENVVRRRDDCGHIISVGLWCFGRIRCHRHQMIIMLKEFMQSYGAMHLILETRECE
mmetsp:Transcript_21764/g.61941  ORF Transcript_21764/g.61941 Transcript_21764/m.61941 type:complete len:265 (-) Transcript_21764:1034-1828(-)